jgi:hypothetical protein
VLIACTTPGSGSTSIPTDTSVAAFKTAALPTPVPVSIIEPIPLPTSVPNQAALLKDATRAKPVGFVIDTQQLEHGVVPWWFQSLDNWYKYTSPDGAFSILMHGGIAPKESTLNNILGKPGLEVKVVKADYLMSEMQAVTYFEDPALISGELTAGQILESLDPTQLLGAVANVEVVADTRIQLSGFPGRDLLVKVAAKGKPDMKTDIHIRFYVVGSTVYQLTFGGFGKSAHETEERFLNSFTLHVSAK